MSRVLKYINFIILLACTVGAAAVYWFVWRVLPQTSGTVHAPTGAAGRVIRDQLGVPHIAAASEADAFFLQGYVTAQDRLFQLELARRQANGELAEIVGLAALEADLEARRLRMRRLAQQHARDLSSSDRAPFAAYARGVNFFIDTHRGNLPVEFSVLGFDPRPWTIADSIAVGLQMFRSLTTSWRDELIKSNLLSGGDPAKVRALFSIGAEAHPGSNAWVVSGSHSTSGKPLLANDPHLGFSLPCVWYQVHLKAADLDVAGVALPGLPGVAIGHNRSIAWGITNLQFDVQDLYRASAVTAQDQEVLRVRGGAQVEAAVLLTRHGPVVHTEANQAYALRWTAADPGFAYAFVDLNRAQNWDEFRRAVSRHLGPGFNFVYADTAGNIGYQVAGRLPVRRSAGDLPQDGSAASEWNGTIPFEQLPSAYNPPDGVLVTANENPFPGGYQHPVHGNFASRYRARQIRHRLESRRDWTPERMLAVQKDVYSAFSHLLAQQIIAASWKRGVTNPNLREAIELLSRWNGQMEAGQPAPLLVTLAYQHLRKAIADRASPGKGSVYAFSLAPELIETLLRSRPPAWFADFDAELVKALDRAVEEGTKLQGSSVSRWDYGRYNQLLLKHPLFGDVNYVRWFARIGPIPMSGSSTTVKQTTRALGPSMRFVADMADLNRSLMNITTGQSGQLLSPHFRNQWDAYYAGRSHPMRYDRVEPAATLDFLPLLQ